MSISDNPYTCIEAMQNALEKGKKPHYRDLELAVENGNQKLVAWMLDYNNGNKFERSDNELRIAAKTGNLDMVEFLLSRNFKFSGRGGEIYAAVCEGHLEMVIFLREKGCKYMEDWDNDESNTGRNEMYAAIEGDYRDIVEWMYTHGYDENCEDTALDIVARMCGS
jgi:ankyrin repeat protein